MINTKNLVVQESDIPSYWVFQYYLNINEKLTGQDIKIKSIWNPGERTPSMCLFVDKKKRAYMFKDFSTGKYGNKINLVQELFNLNYSGAIEKMINDYNHYAKSNSLEDIVFKPQSKWKLDFVKIRSWNQDDANYWLQYRIGSTLLNEYNVKPIEYYNLVKEESDGIKSLKIKNNYIYGYFTQDGEVYKIYQPKSKRRFFKVKSHIQGLDQLKYNQPYLVICSSLKDAICLKSFGYNIEVIAPDSENTMIKPYIIENLKNKYKKCITLFDNDDAGYKAIKRYNEVYQIKGTSLQLSKDISDAISQFDFKTVHQELKPLLKEALK
tara:strand:- start:1613 stop:2584 length:972 start_codon:yes stop_codon:yes gene_type:complete